MFGVALARQHWMGDADHILEELDMKPRTQPLFRRFLAVLPAIAMTGVIYSGTAIQPAMAQLEEIIVTARKREEALVDIPFAVSAFSDADLTTANLKNFVDLSQFTPGLTFQNATINRADRGTPNIIIRGLNLQSFSGSSDPALFFIDGAPVFGGEVGSFIDIVRVEVLRGPQSAYFGRNTFSGAINLITRDPGDEFGGSAGLEYGRFGTTDLQLSVEGPIIPGRLNFRLSGRSNKKGGHYINHASGDRDVGEEKTRSLAGTLMATPNDKVRLKFRYDYTDIDDGPNAGFRFGRSFANCDPDGNGTMTYRCGEGPDVSIAEAMVGHSDAFDPGYFNNVGYVENVVEAYSLFSDTSTRQVDGEGVFIDGMGLAKRVYGATFQAAVDLPAGMTFDWISGYSKTLQQIVSDENTLPRNNFRVVLGDVFLVERYSKNSSHEARLSSDGDRQLRWTAGASFVESEGITSCVAGIFIRPRAFNCRPILKTETTGVFGGLYYDLSEKLTVSAELRVQKDTVSIPITDLEEEFDDVGGRVTLQYTTADGLMWFANYGRGFRPGGFNSIFATLSQSEAASLSANSGAKLDVEPETLDQYEVGVKGALLEGRLQASAIGYWGEINDQQVQQVTTYNDQATGLDVPITILNNIGLLDLYGVELEARFQLTNEWMLQGSFARNHTEYVQGSCRICVTRGAMATDQDHLGNQTPKVPEFTASAAATYSRPVFGGGLDGFIRGEYLYESTEYALEANQYETGARNIVNLRLGVEAQTYRIEAYVTNLFDDDTYLFVTPNSDLDAGGANAFVVGLPDKLAYGLRVTVDF